MKSKPPDILLFLILGLASVVVYRNIQKLRATITPVSIDDKIRFMRRMKPIAEAIQKQYGIKTVITIGQSALESNWGTSKLTLEANNLFGIKATGSWINRGLPVWRGKTYEFVHTYREELASFKKYESYEQSTDDWAKLLSTRTRYATLYKYAKQGDIENFGKEITKSGYATDPNYDLLFSTRSKEVSKYV